MPKSTMPVLGKIAQRLRNCCAHHLFAECQGNVNLEQGAYFGNGKDVRVLNDAGIGKDLIVHSRILTIYGHIMMEEDILMQGGNHSFADPNKPIGSEKHDKEQNTKPT